MHLPDTGDVAPARRLETVRAIVPVGGMPPKRMPWVSTGNRSRKRHRQCRDTDRQAEARIFEEALTPWCRSVAWRIVNASYFD